MNLHQNRLRNRLVLLESQKVEVFQDLLQRFCFRILAKHKQLQKDWKTSIFLRKSLRALFQFWTILNINVKEMDFLIPMRNLPVLVNPDQGVFNLRASLGRLMNADINR